MCLKQKKIYLQLATSCHLLLFHLLTCSTKFYFEVLSWKVLSQPLFTHSNISNWFPASASSSSFSSLSDCAASRTPHIKNRKLIDCHSFHFIHKMLEHVRVAVVIFYWIWKVCYKWFYLKYELDRCIWTFTWERPCVWRNWRKLPSCRTL